MRLFAGIFALVIASGCGSAGPRTSGLPPADKVSRDISVAIPTLGPDVFDTRTGLPDAKRVSREHREGCLNGDPWTVVGVSTDGRKLLLHTGGASGLRVRYAGSAVRETTSSVEIGLYRIQLKHNDTGAISAVDPLPVLIVLKQPLGHRSLLHAPITHSC